MAERVLKVKTVSEVAESIAGLTELGGSLRGVGTAAFEAAGKSKAAWKEAEAEWQRSSPTLKGVAAAAFEVESALNKMGRASSESQLEAGLVKSQVALAQFKAKLDEVRAAGGTIDDQMLAALAAMQAGVDAGNRKLVAMRTATQEARAALGLLGSEGKKAGASIEAGSKSAWAALEKLGDAGQEAAVALTKLEAAADSPDEVAKNAARAELAIERLTAEFQKAGGAGAGMGREVSDALARAKRTIDETIDSAGKLARKKEELNQRMGLTAKGAEALSGRLGSVQGAMGLLADSSSGLAQGIAKVGFVTFALQEAWKLAQSLGGALAKKVDEVAFAQERAAKKVEDAQVAHIKFNHALSLAKQGLIELGGSHDEFMARYDAFIAKKSPGGQAIEAETTRLREQKRALDELGSTIDRLNQTEGFSIKGPEDAFLPWKEAEKNMEAFQEVFGRALMEGGKEAVMEWAVANEELLSRVVAAYQRFGQEVPALVLRAYDEMKAGTTQAAADMTKSVQDSVDAAVKARKEWEAQGNAIRDRTTATEASERAQAQLNRATHDGIIEMNGWVGVQGAAQFADIKITEATEAQNEAFRERLRLMKAMREETEKSLDAAKGWSDYITIATESFVNGGTSLQGFLKILSEFSTQLQTMYGPGGTGTVAEKRLKAMIDLLRDLMAAASSGQLKGGTAPTGIRGWLEEALGDGAGI